MLIGLVLSIALAAGTPAPPQHAGITIVINGDTLPIDPPPLVRGNALLVPVRRTIESLGLPFARSGKFVQTQVASKTVILTVGSRVAQVDGRSVQLDANVTEIDGVLYAPLRFFTDALGAQVRYDAKARVVTIVAQIVGRTSNGLQATGSGYQRSGPVAAVDVLSDPPTLTFGYDTGPKTVPIARNAIVEMQDVNANVTTPGELGDVRPGDFARVEMRKDGRVERVIDAFGSRTGHLVAVSGNLGVLDDGQVVAPGRTTEISLNGKAASFSDLRAGDDVAIRYNVETNEVREILASRSLTGATPAPAPGAARIAGVSTDANAPLRAGQAVRVTLHGSPGGSATFAIGSYVTDLAMHESPSGTYTGSYTIPQGANFDGVPVIGTLALAGQAPVEAQAPQLLSASSTPPGIVDFAPDAGAVVNTSRPAVYATFSSAAVPVSPSSALLWVNGRDVTADCVRTAQFIQYLPSYSYPDGSINVTVRVSDRAGNTTTKSWTFVIRTH